MTNGTNLTPVGKRERKNISLDKKRLHNCILLSGLREKRQNSSESSYEDLSLDERTLRNRVFYHPLILRGGLPLTALSERGQPPGQC